ncbi:uncharacterized protein LOC111077745 isoform X2 [Drosophila obscura]|uniref:uncharacterized protein LOC111077745 isoform X2 n=1 Tax=Drosophila obscura TaxID=7282 RepID=UPI000BA14570|nr:uncharacterized protein LOC111077745 isoform X2 [Drosophila obscura]
MRKPRGLDERRLNGGSGNNNNNNNNGWQWQWQRQRQRHPNFIVAVSCPVEIAHKEVFRVHFLQVFQRLKGFNLTEEDLNAILEMGFANWRQQYENVLNLPHRDESYWFLKDATRRDAEELLRGSPSGTFLIRVRNAGHYALSIVCKGNVQHCIIYETESGFGFAAPYNIYPTLKKLVEHYATNSLEEHNDTLTTTLRLPVYYWEQNRAQILEELEMEREQEAAASSQASLGSSSAPIPTPRVRSDLDQVDGGETETPPASISPSNFSTSQ